VGYAEGERYITPNQEETTPRFGLDANPKCAGRSKAKNALGYGFLQLLVLSSLLIALSFSCKSLQILQKLASIDKIFLYLQGTKP
jgi:hypothetical protein